MKLYLIASVLGIFSSCGPVSSSDSALSNRSFVNQSGAFPRSPESITPGSVCDRPDSRRYPERIAYCSRDVEDQLKKEIFKDYDERYGFRTQVIARSQFKIDHLIPLCMGGSNEQDNLWPQHESIYTLTDPIEPFLCEILGRGKLKQVEAIQIIREVKQAPETTAARMAAIQRSPAGSK